MTLITSFIIEKGLWQASMTLSSSASNSNGFYSLGANGNLATTESDRTITIPFDVEITRVQCNAPVNSKDAATTVSFRDDGVDIGTLTFAINTPSKQDSGAISVIVASGSLVCFRIDTSTSTSGNFQAAPVIVTGRIRTVQS